MTAVISRIKTLGRMDVAEKRRPQDGRLKTKTQDDHEIELRLSTLPTAFGEKMVMRIFDPDILLKTFEQLGLADDDFDRWQGMVKNPNGILLVTGPTGSGKTTTLYSSLKQLATEDVNVCTIEDPIEMVEPSFNQMQVNHNIDLTLTIVLQRNVKRNKYPNIKLRNQACGSSHGETKLFFSTENEGNHKIIENSNSNNFALTEVVTLSTFLNEYSPSLIKMDIEGAELLALQGLGQENLKKLDIDFVIEYHPYEMSFFDIEGEQVLDFFIDTGYKFRNLAYPDLPIISREEILKKYKKKDRSITNLFCSKTID